MEYSEILWHEEDQIGRLTLNRPEKRNSLGPRTVSELCHALEHARESDTVRVIVLSGVGSVFSAGGDLAQLGGPSPSAEEADDISPRTFVDLLLLFTQMGKPTIAMVNGHAMAGGLGLVVACDLALAADTAQFATPEINVGLWPMMIMANIFRNIGRKQGMQLILTGEKISAAHAARIGLINEAVPQEALEAHTLTLAQKLASKSPTALRLGLEAFYQTSDLALDPALDFLERQLAAVLSSEDAKEGIQAFLAKRPPRFVGC